MSSKKEKRKFGSKVRIAAYITTRMYEALRSIADPDEDEPWEARISRKAYGEYLDKRGVIWKENNQEPLQAQPRKQIKDLPDPAKDRVRSGNPKSVARRD